MPMSKRLDDPAYLTAEQYRDDANLAARIALHQRFSTNRQGWLPWVFDHLASLPAAACILELGCGTGSLWLENQDRLPATWQLALTDLSPGMLATAQARLRGGIAQTAFAVVDAQAIPFAAGAFDAVIANHMLYHVPDRPRALREIRRVLRPGGRFYAATNGHRHLRALDELVQTYAPEAAGENAATGFGLENGAAQLRPWFAQVSRADFPDGLAITEVDPLVAYLRSTSAKDVLDRDRLDRLRGAVAATIARDGAWHATKEVGLFCCVA